MYFFRCVVEQGFKLGFKYNEITSQYVSMSTDSEYIRLFLQSLLDEINRCRVLGQQNPVEASKNSPIHGRYICLSIQM